jgi:hypothetical protein
MVDVKNTDRIQKYFYHSQHSIILNRKNRHHIFRNAIFGINQRRRLGERIQFVRFHIGLNGSGKLGQPVPDSNLPPAWNNAILIVWPLLLGMLQALVANAFSAVMAMEHIILRSRHFILESVLEFLRNKEPLRYAI